MGTTRSHDGHTITWNPNPSPRSPDRLFGAPPKCSGNSLSLCFHPPSGPSEEMVDSGPLNSQGSKQKRFETRDTGALPSTSLTLLAHRRCSQRCSRRCSQRCSRRCSQRCRWRWCPRRRYRRRCSCHRLHLAPQGPLDSSGREGCSTFSGCVLHAPSGVGISPSAGMRCKDYVYSIVNCVCLYGWMDGWMHACMHAWMYSKVITYTYIHTYMYIIV